VHNAEHRRAGGLHSLPGGREPCQAPVVELDPEVRASRGATEGVDCLWRWGGCVVREHERSEGLPELAQTGCVASGDASACRDEALRSEPGAGLLRRAETVPITRQLMVPRIQKALKQLQATRCLRPPTGLDLLADSSLVSFVHGQEMTFRFAETSITFMLVMT